MVITPLFKQLSNTLIGEVLPLLPATNSSAASQLELPQATTNYGGSYTYPALEALAQRYGSMEVPSSYVANSTGMIADPTLSAAQQILSRPRNVAAPMPLLGSGLLKDYEQGYEPTYYGMAPSTLFAQPQALGAGAEGPSDVSGLLGAIGGE